MSQTVIEHVLGRLKSIGIDHIFGVAGDFAFPVDDAIVNFQGIEYCYTDSGYLIERLLCKNPAIAYNDIASWCYSKIPDALGCDGWFTARVTTCGEFDQALKAVEQESTAAYIEVITDKYATPPLGKKFHESIKTLYPS
jgi:indolepyruvate decarboxylase